MNLDHIKKHRRDFTGVSWWGTASIVNDTAGVHFHYNSTYADGEAMLKKDTPEIDLFPVLEADPPLMAAAATQAATAAAAHGWAGFNVDYEPGGMWSAPEFARFLANLQPLALALHAVGLELSVDICCAYSDIESSKILRIRPVFSVKLRISFYIDYTLNKWKTQSCFIYL